MPSWLPQDPDDGPLMEPDAQIRSILSRMVVLIPAFNEEASLPGLLEELAEHLPACPVCVVDDGSSDRTVAVARAAGEVAPLMLVGVVKLAPSLPLDGNYPYLHLDQKIMHLGFHIYDVGFQSPNVEAARPLVYATALLLVLVIALLNFAAVYIRNHLREKYKALDH